MAAPADASAANELTRTVTQMRGLYGKGRYCPEADRCLRIDDITRVTAASRDPAQLLDIWTGWHRIGPPMRTGYGLDDVRGPLVRHAH